jgi:hypothetical protein
MQRTAVDHTHGPPTTASEATRDATAGSLARRTGEPRAWLFFAKPIMFLSYLFYVAFSVKIPKQYRFSRLKII